VYIYLFKKSCTVLALFNATEVLFLSSLAYCSGSIDLVTTSQKLGCVTAKEEFFKASLY